MTRIAGRLSKISESLERQEFFAEAAEGADQVEEAFRVSFDGPLDIRSKQVFGKAGGHELEAKFGEFIRIFGKVPGEGFPSKVGVQEVLLFQEPIFVAAAGHEIGDIALGDGDFAFFEHVNDAFVWHTVAKHATDHVAFEFGEAGDSAVAAGFAFGPRGLIGWGVCSGKDVQE